jgi:hypothetical protein
MGEDRMAARLECAGNHLRLTKTAPRRKHFSKCPLKSHLDLPLKNSGRETSNPVYADDLRRTKLDELEDVASKDQDAQLGVCAATTL